MTYYGVEISRYDFVYEPINDLNCCTSEIRIIEKDSAKKPENRKKHGGRKWKDVIWFETQSEAVDFINNLDA